MTVAELLAHPDADDLAFQLLVNAFVDDFRRAEPEARAQMVADGPDRAGPREGLVAAVVSALCREVGDEAPRWVRETRSPTPYFVIPARGFALRVRLMLESPPPFRARNVFVPENYLARA